MDALNAHSIHPVSMRIEKGLVVDTALEDKQERRQIKQNQLSVLYRFFLPGGELDSICMYFSTCIVCFAFLWFCC